MEHPISARPAKVLYKSASSELRGNECASRNGADNLGVLENGLPDSWTAERLLRHDDHIPGLQRRIQRLAPQAGVAADDGAVGADHEDRPLVGEIGRPAAANQIPASALTRMIGDGSRPVDLALHQDEAGTLGNGE